MSNGVSTDKYLAVSEVFSALASPLRCAIIHLLSQEAHTVSELVEATGETQPLVSHHLKMLRLARLVTPSRQGRNMSYELADKHVAHVFLDAYTHTEEENHD